VYGLDLRFSSSLSYRVPGGVSISLQALNLFSLGRNQRLWFDAGNVNQNLQHVDVIEEPRAWGLKLDYEY
jgi:hypothetical protein